MAYGIMPRGPLTAVSTETDCAAADKFYYQIEQVRERVQKALQAAQQRQAHYANLHCEPEEFQVGDKVLVSTKHLCLKGDDNKLQKPFIGPYPILERMRAVAYKLELPQALRVQPVFHVSLLKRYLPEGRVVPPPPPQLTNGGEFWEVERILEDRVRRGGREFLLKFTVFGPEENRWTKEGKLYFCPHQGLLEEQAKKDLVDLSLFRAASLLMHEA